jgi:dihydroneopterin aldolase
MGDAICINGIRGYGYTGYLDEEQVLGQWFEVTLRIGLDLSRTGADDELAHSLDYGLVVQRVRGLLEQSRFRTIERLAAVICDAVLEFGQVQRVEVALTKVAAPIPGFDGRIAIEMTRHRDDRP